MHLDDTLMFIPAGGKGERLFPLTKHRAKPAVPFWGIYRIIDFVLSNSFNSGIRKIYVARQFGGRPLQRNVIKAWKDCFGRDEFCEVLGPDTSTGPEWYQGNADCVFQNLESIEEYDEKNIAIFSADHIYKMDISQMLDYHKDTKADLTISAIPVERKYANQFGVVQIDNKWKMTGFHEKPEDSELIDSLEIPDKPGYILASMGNYIFEKDELINHLYADSLNDSSDHDFGKNIIPNLLYEGKKIMIYDYSKNRMIDKEPYWRDVGTIDAYFEANMDLVSEKPLLNLYKQKPKWEIISYSPNFPPAKTVLGGYNKDSMVGNGCITSAAFVNQSVLSPNVRVNKRAHLENSIIMEGTVIAEDVKLSGVIIDKKNYITAEIAKVLMEAKKTPELHQKNGFFVSEGGIVVVPKQMYVDGFSKT